LIIDSFDGAIYVLIKHFRRLPESLHALGRDPAIYVLIKHFFGRFFVPFVFFYLFCPQKSPIFLVRWRFDEKLR